MAGTYTNAQSRESTDTWQEETNVSQTQTLSAAHFSDQGFFFLRGKLVPELIDPADELSWKARWGRWLSFLE